jgi:hypothetical protein
MHGGYEPSLQTPAVCRRRVFDLRPDAQRQLARLAAGCLLVLFLAQCLVLVRANAPTYDEGTHIASGYSNLARRDFRLERYNPPLINMLLASVLFFAYRLPFDPPDEQWRAAAEFAIGQSFLYASPLHADQILAVGRLSNVLLGALLVALIGWWALRLWGRWAAVVAIALASLEPTLVAHASLATVDVGVSLFIVLALYLLWEHAVAPSAWRLAGSGIALGLAFVSKYSSITVLPMIALIVVGHILLGDVIAGPGPKRRTAATVGERVRQGTTVLVLVLIPVLAVIPATYFFQGFATWLSGLELLLRRGGQPAFLLGRYSPEGWWYYFPIAFLLKTPLGSLFLIVVGLALARAGTPLRGREALFLLMPVLLFFGVMTQAPVNIGVRYVLPVYPFLFVLASRVVTISTGRAWVMPSLVVLALTLTAVSTLRVMPYQLAYFNELVGGPDAGSRYLSDSNIDWGQELKRLRAFMERERVPIIYLSYFGTAPPAYYGIRYQYVPGSWPLEWPPPADLVPAEQRPKLLAISLVNLQEVGTHELRLFAWLHRREPVAKIGYSIRVYDLTHDLDGLVDLSEAYVKMGLNDFALAEASKVLSLDPSHARAIQVIGRALARDG